MEKSSLNIKFRLIPISDKAAKTLETTKCILAQNLLMYNSTRTAIAKRRLFPSALIYIWHCGSVLIPLHASMPKRGKLTAGRARASNQLKAGLSQVEQGCRWVAQQLTDDQM